LCEVRDSGASWGAREFVRGSLTRRPWALQLTPFKACGETTLQKYYHPEDILTLTGRAGFGFVEDSFGFHRGIAPTRRARLMLEIRIWMLAAAGPDVAAITPTVSPFRADLGSLNNTDN